MDIGGEGMDAQKREITLAVSARIKYFRHLRLMSQEDLALKAEINPVYFGQVERGLKCPTIDTLCKIAKALEVSPSELLRTDALPMSTIGQDQRFQELLSRIPEAKREKILSILEDLIPLL